MSYWVGWVCSWLIIPAFQSCLGICGVASEHCELLQIVAMQTSSNTALCHLLWLVSVCLWDVMALCRLSVCAAGVTQIWVTAFEVATYRGSERDEQEAQQIQEHSTMSAALSVCLSVFLFCLSLCLLHAVFVLIYVTISVLRCNFSISIRRHFPYSIARSYFFSCRHQRLSTCHVFL